MKFFNKSKVQSPKSKTGMGKRGQIGEGVVMIYRLLIVTVIAFIIFGVGSVFYDYEIDVRDAEARILGREVIDCLAPEGVLDLDKISKNDYGRIVSYCGILGEDRFYVGIDVLDSSGNKVIKLYEGDSGVLWLTGLYGRAVVTGQAVAGVDGNGKYEPGYFKVGYPVFILVDGVRSKGSVDMEVLVSYE